MSVAALRYFTVYGPRQRPDMGFHRFCKAMLAGEPLVVYGDGRQSRDFTFIADAVEANVRAGTRGSPQCVVNVGGGSQVEVLEAIAILEGALGVPAQLDFRPRPPGDPLRTRADASRLSADLEFVPRVPIQDGLDFVPATGIEDGLRAEADWARGLYGGAPAR
jgi:UDP-glucose 4-epimerase